MNIRKPKTVKQTASQLLNRAPRLGNVMLTYCGIVLAQCIVVTALNYLIDHLLSQSGGLGNMGRRTVLSTFSMVLPILHTLALMVLDMGLLNAMLRTSRGQYASAQSLRMGLSRFWGLIGCTLCKIMIFMACAMAVITFGMNIFLMSPLGGDSMAVLEPLFAASSDPMEIADMLLADPALTAAYLRSVVPLYVIMIIALVLVLIPFFYRTRFAEFILIDKPTFGGFRAVMESFRLTRKNWTPLLKLDISFWWYHLLSLLVTLISYMDFVPELLGLALPWSGTVNALVFYGIYLIAQILLYYYLRPRLEVSTALIYNALRPAEDNQGQVLGNIFQM